MTAALLNSYIQKSDDEQIIHMANIDVVVRVIAREVIVDRFWW
jgi:hypothetical protein